MNSAASPCAAVAGPDTVCTPAPTHPANPEAAATEGLLLGADAGACDEADTHRFVSTIAHAADDEHGLAACLRRAADDIDRGDLSGGCRFAATVLTEFLSPARDEHQQNLATIRERRSMAFAAIDPDLAEVITSALLLRHFGNEDDFDHALLALRSHLLCFGCPDPKSPQPVWLTEVCTKLVARARIERQPLPELVAKIGAEAREAANIAASKFGSPDAESAQLRVAHEERMRAWNDLGRRLEGRSSIEPRPGELRIELLSSFVSDVLGDRLSYELKKEQLTPREEQTVVEWVEAQVRACARIGGATALKTVWSILVGDDDTDFMAFDDLGDAPLEEMVAGARKWTMWKLATSRTTAGHMSYARDMYMVAIGMTAVDSGAPFCHPPAEDDGAAWIRGAMGDFVARTPGDNDDICNVVDQLSFGMHLVVMEHKPPPAYRIAAIGWLAQRGLVETCSGKSCDEAVSP